MNIQLLPDKGERLLKQVQDLEAALNALNISTADTTEEGRAHFFISFSFFYFFFFSPRALQNSLSYC